MLTPIQANPRDGGVPIRYYLAPEMMPDADTTAQLEDLARAPGLDHYVAVLPDVHRKARNVSPTGVVVAARNAIVPRAVDTGVSCGMRMIRTEIDARELTAPVLDALFGELMRTMPLRHDDDVLSEEDVAEILVQGGRWCQKPLGVTDDELECIEDRASMPRDTDDIEAILASVPKKAIKKGRRRFCTMGGGNHFLELQEIVEVLDRRVAGLLGLVEGKALFMLHSDSRGVAGSVMKAYLEERREKHRRVAANGPPIWSVPADSAEGAKLARALAAAANFGFANRIAITETLRAVVRRVLLDQSLAMPLLYDCAHVSIKPEQWNGETLWVHRHGASRALPASRLADHPLFSQTGQPVPIPGSMGDDSFIGVPDERVVDTFFSVNHGAGRVMDKPEARARFSEEQVEREMRIKNIRLYRYGSDNIAEQAPGSFKDIGAVVAALSSLSLARPVVRLRPLAVLKG